MGRRGVGCGDLSEDFAIGSDSALKLRRQWREAFAIRSPIGGVWQWGRCRGTLDGPRRAPSGFGRARLRHAAPDGGDTGKG